MRVSVDVINCEFTGLELYSVFAYIKLKTTVDLRIIQSVPDFVS